VLTRTVQGQVDAMARKFIAGASPADALPHLRNRWDQGIAFSVDLLGEACLSGQEAQVYQRRYIELIEQLSFDLAGWPSNDLLERDHLGSIPRINVSIKISSLSARLKPIDPQSSIESLIETLSPILTLAGEK